MTYDFEFGRLLIDSKHIYIMFDSNVTVDEYDLLAMTDDIENEADRNDLFRFLDHFIPRENKTYWTLRGDVRMLQAYWEVRQKEGVSKDDIDKHLFDVRQCNQVYDYTYPLFYSNIESIVKKYNMKNYE